MAWEENSCISLNMQLIAILSRIGVINWHHKPLHYSSISIVITTTNDRFIVFKVESQLLTQSRHFNQSLSKMHLDVEKPVK